MSDKTQIEWEERFDDIKPVADIDIRDGEWLISQKEAKDFINQELARQKNEIVEETKVKEYGEDEAYCMWYRCSNCKDTMITVESNFCPNCGRKIAWGDESDTTN